MVDHKQLAYDLALKYAGEKLHEYVNGTDDGHEGCCRQALDAFKSAYDYLLEELNADA